VEDEMWKVESGKNVLEINLEERKMKMSVKVIIVNKVDTKF
jgi:hypothetical protein